MIVDDDRDAIQVLGRMLSSVRDLRFATCGQDALRLALESPPDLILLDAEMPGMTGFEVLQALKDDPALGIIPVILVSSHCHPAFQVLGFDKGAADFIAKPLNASLVVARVRRQLAVKHMADELRRISTVDALTGLANRRRFDEALESEWRRSARSDAPLALLMIDVDHFKLFNDRYGHPAGDACLRLVAQALFRGSMRPADLVARYGGEEFAVLLPHTHPGGAQQVADRMITAVKGLAIAHESSSTADHVTVSVGMSSYDRAAVNWSAEAAGLRRDDPWPQYAAVDLVRSADAALYAAKGAGRAQVCSRAIADAHAHSDHAARCPQPPVACPA